MEDLLLLIHRIPYPPNKGDKIRSYHLLKHLARDYKVHLATFVDDPDDWQHVPTVEKMCASSHFAALNPTLARVRSLGALVKKRSLSLDYYRDAGLARWVDQTVAAHRIQRVLVFSSAMAQYADKYPNARRVVDFCDVDSDKWRQYADKKSWPMSWLYRHEARQLLSYERQVARDYDASLFVSAPEADLFRQLAPESDARIGFFSNGVDTEYFAPDAAGPSPFKEGEQAIVFTGAMDYWPNVDAVQWFASEAMPLLRARFPELRFYIVGARPAPAVQELAKQPNIVVTGTVPDVRPYIKHARAAVAPLRIARGIQNKVLEAMAMATPVVVTPQALEGIEAEPGRELVLAQDAAGFVEAVAQLLARSGNDMGLAARARVERKYSWPSNLACIGERLECS
ncbi:TIGR03087 family PEP-CTERM/XrtA system glycosyltransferase [Massilia sp. LC238]|uniref:TIGR03087 family PEP-CTERM/XrtA system glycosyltransferase n=1 Tax=Massilia sp. LC238 TaxID=1502852 RepID=UPI0004E2C9F0|nr:TIGR03087 family PEP-CTERM/XrtA system glycosyltransferase [Massilia sp. LC238]KFC66151.1 Sugar transferase, PEP-CTERM/EpsH1 system associated [Massilia sp. LC238]